MAESQGWNIFWQITVFCAVYALFFALRKVIRYSIICMEKKGGFYMNLTIENIALIKKAEIELSGITVVAGWNKTGKTTISKALYAVIGAYKNLPLKVSNSKRNGISNVFFNILRPNKELLENIPFLIAEIEEEFVDSIKDKDLLEWAADDKHKGVREYINQWVHSKKEYEKYIRKEEIDALYKEICIVLERADQEYESFLIESFVKNVFKKQISCFFNHNNGRIRCSHLDDVLETVFVDNELSDFGKNIVSNTSAIYIESINLLDLIQSNGRTRRTAVKLSQPTTTCVRMLEQIADRDEETYEEYTESKKIDSIIHYIVQKVTHGSLKKNFSGISFVDEKGKEPVELSNLSAGLKVFVVIQTLLENGSLKSGDLLLIDEPEVNLHPEWQLVLAEILVLLRKELGIVIYINSHSPYFIRAIEVKLAQNEMTMQGKFYLTMPDKDDMYCVEDVSQNTERIYELLYKPLEEL